MYVGDKVLIAPGTKLAEIETSFVVNPHANKKYGSYYMPYIAGYEGITIYDYYETSIEEFFLDFLHMILIMLLKLIILKLLKRFQL